MQLVVLLAIAGLATPAIVPIAASTSTSTSPASTLLESTSCEQTATHDAFREPAAIEAVNETGSATSSVKNTKVRVEDSTGFLRLQASNPNGYCVSFTVEIAEEIVSPADLGEVESLNETTVASWRAAQNLESGTVYTEITFTLGPGTSATWSPSTVRVESLAWTGTAKNKSDGLLDGLPSLFGEGKLEKRHYTISATNSTSRVTVPLERDGKTISEWRATYTLDGETSTVGQDASSPVYYTESEGSVTFHFDREAVRKNASVKFVAEPTFTEKVGYRADSYIEGFTEGLGDLVPFSIAVRPEVIP